jgi:acyl-CoA thioesterase-1
VPVGDSISNGAHATSENLRYINILASKIEQEFGYDVKIIDDFTIPGSGLKDNGIPNLQEIIELEPDFITLGFGTNDLSEEMLNAYSNPEEFETQLNFMLDTLIKEINDLKIVLVSTWRNGEDSEVYDNIIYEVGNQKAIQVVNISEVWENRVDTVGPKDVLTPYGISDSWHPNNLGHSLIAEKVYEKSYIILK